MSQTTKVPNEAYKWYLTDKTAWQPASLCSRKYYTDEEYEEIRKKNPNLELLRVPEGDNLYTREIARLNA